MPAAVMIGLAVVLLGAFILMVRVQYGYITELRKLKHKTGAEQNAYYENLSYEEEQLHFSMQGGFWPAAAVASFIYKLRHSKA
ncbi:DUF3949 domain-containing protein [Paenibacillus tuaregi]|uniref:DUF3949 domain-containing protein n=1 Tax=Paenibacillus tuaregi TaxID=1816681 RepID=UPI00083835DF|nr:DUF3949 domain-containing protein [Paenibacillus tuaregi]